MALPEKYQPLDSFQRLDPEIGVKLDRNFTSIARTISQLVDVLAVLARADSKLANSTVTIQALTGDLYRFIQGQNGNWKLKGQWQGLRRFTYGDIVEFNSQAYGCVIDHDASQDFNFDRAQGYWQILTGDTGASPSLEYVDNAIASSSDNVLQTVSQIYLTATEAANTYITNQLAFNTFLSISTAANSYLTLANAAQTYATIQSLQQYAPLNSPKFTGVPESPTPTAGDFTKKIATTEFVKLNADSVGNMQVFTSSGTFVVPAGVRKIKATVQGGGGSWDATGGSSSFGSYATASGGAPTSGGVGVGGNLNIRGGNGGVRQITIGCSIYEIQLGGGSFFGFGGFDDGAASGFGGGGSLRSVGAGGGGGGCAIGVYSGFVDGQVINVTVGAGAISGGGGGSNGSAGVVILEW